MNPSDFNRNDLEARLRRDASRVPSPARDGMNERILRAVRQSQAADAPEPVRRALPWLSLSLGAAAALIALAAVTLRHSNVPETAQPIDERQLADAVTSMPRQMWASLQPKATALLANDPLREDANALYADARSAGKYLALNFLPSS